MSDLRKAIIVFITFFDFIVYIGADFKYTGTPTMLITTHHQAGESCIYFFTCIQVVYPVNDFGTWIIYHKLRPAWPSNGIALILDFIMENTDFTKYICNNQVRLSGIYWNYFYNSRGCSTSGFVGSN